MIDPKDFIITRKRKKYKFAHFANLENCFEVSEWKKLSADKPLVIELGAGTALFSVELAKRHPDRHYVAIDVKADRLQTGARRAIDEEVGNIYFLRAHADQLVDLFDPGSVRELWLTFSDPFPKSRHAKHRMTHPRFLATYRQLLSSEGHFLFKTDNHALFDWSLEQLVMRGWTIRKLSFDLHESGEPEETKIVTTFESRFIAEELPIYFLYAEPPRLADVHSR